VPESIAAERAARLTGVSEDVTADVDVAMEVALVEVLVEVLVTVVVTVLEVTAPAPAFAFPKAVPTMPPLRVRTCCAKAHAGTAARTTAARNRVDLRIAKSLGSAPNRSDSRLIDRILRHKL
jgi:hypothetical protein